MATQKRQSLGKTKQKVQNPEELPWPPWEGMWEAAVGRMPLGHRLHLSSQFLSWEKYIQKEQWRNDDWRNSTLNSSKLRWTGTDNQIHGVFRIAVFTRNSPRVYSWPSHISHQFRNWMTLPKLRPAKARLKEKSVAFTGFWGGGEDPRFASDLFSGPRHFSIS